VAPTNTYYTAAVTRHSNMLELPSLDHDLTLDQWHNFVYE
jgi:hypothetical protein